MKLALDAVAVHAMRFQCCGVVLVFLSRLVGNLFCGV
jgi:hypothetical protein